jgi:hypothetical protein
VAKTVTDRLLRVEDVLEDDAHFRPGGRLPKTEIRERRPGKRKRNKSKEFHNRNKKRKLSLNRMEEKENSFRLHHLTG